MGRTWPNLEAEPIARAGYYWNGNLKKLARLQLGEKLPKGVGAWEFIAGEREGSSSEIARRIFDRYPGLDVNDFTYTTTTPLDRRLPMGDRGRRLSIGSALLGAGVLALGFVALRAVQHARACA